MSWRSFRRLRASPSSSSILQHLKVLHLRVRVCFVASCSSFAIFLVLSASYSIWRSCIYRCHGFWPGSQYRLPDFDRGVKIQGGQNRLGHRFSFVSSPSSFAIFQSTNYRHDSVPKTAICQTQTTWLDERPPVEICQKTRGRDILDKQNENCNWDSTGRREPFKRVLQIIKTRARCLHCQIGWKNLSASFSTRLSSCNSYILNILKTVGLKS